MAPTNPALPPPKQVAVEVMVGDEVKVGVEVQVAVATGVKVRVGVAAGGMEVDVNVGARPWAVEVGLGVAAKVKVVVKVNVGEEVGDAPPAFVAVAVGPFPGLEALLLEGHPTSDKIANPNIINGKSFFIIGLSSP